MKVEIRFSEVPKDDINSSSEPTDDESYSKIHQIREKIENLLITRFELRRVKAHGRSAVAVAAARSNLKRNLKTLEEVMSQETRLEYELEGVDVVPWAENSGEVGLQVKF